MRRPPFLSHLPPPPPWQREPHDGNESEGSKRLVCEVVHKVEGGGDCKHGCIEQRGILLCSIVPAYTGIMFQAQDRIIQHIHSVPCGQRNMAKAAAPAPAAASGVARQQEQACAVVAAACSSSSIAAA